MLPKLLRFFATKDLAGFWEGFWIFLLQQTFPPRVVLFVVLLFFSIRDAMILVLGNQLDSSQFAVMPYCWIGSLSTMHSNHAPEFVPVLAEGSLDVCICDAFSRADFVKWHMCNKGEIWSSNK